MADNHDHRPGRRDIILKALGAVTLAGLGKASSSVALAADSNASSLVLTPEMTEGPYWVDEELNRADIIYDPTTGTLQEGFPLILVIKVYQVSTGSIASLPNAQVDIWQANALGVYSDETVENTSGEKFLRGYQITNSKGLVHFLTIYPGWYSGRTPHIHCRVRVYDGSSLTYNFTTQFFFDQSITNAVYLTSPYNTRKTQDTYNETDMVYTATDCMTGNEVGSETLLKLVQNAKSISAEVVIKLDLALPNNSTCSTGPGGGPPPPPTGM